MPVPLPQEMLLFCVAVAAAQLFFTSLFLFRARRPAKAAQRPPASVIVPCKGAGPGLEACALSLLAQDYRAPLEFIFVVPDRADPAFAALRAVLERAGDARAKVSVSGASPERCSEKALNLLHGAALASPESRLLAFADSDLVFARGWLERLAAPLADPAVAVATAHALPPPGGLAASLLRLWAAYGSAYLSALGVVSGNSMALRRADFERLGVERAWRASLCEDLALGRLARAAGGRIEHVPGAAPSCAAGTPREVLALTNKWTFYFRVYQPLIWLSGAALTAFKLYAFGWTAAKLYFPPLALLLLGDLLNLALLSSAQRANGGPVPARHLAASVLLLPILNAANFLTSLFRTEVYWGGRRYRPLGPGRVEVLAPGAPAAAPPAAVYALLALAGALTGAAYFAAPLGWLAWFSVAPLYLAALRSSPRGAFLSGWLFGTAGWLTGLAWMAGPLAEFLRLPPAPGLAAFAFLCAAQGLMFALLAWLPRALAPFLARRLGWGEGAAFLAAAMPAAALAEAWFPALFRPYIAITQLWHLPGVQLLEFTGPAGLAWLLYGFNAALALLARDLLERRPARRAAAALAAFCLLAAANEAFGRARLLAVEAEAAAALAAGRSLRVSLLQGCAPVADASRVLNAPGLKIYRALTAQAAAQDRPGLVIWPESVYGRGPLYSPGADGRPAFEPGFARAFSADIPPGPPLLLGSEGGEAGGGRTYNLAFSVDAGRALTGVVKKRLLFPFGEYIPFETAFPRLRAFLPGAGRLSAGGEPEPLPAGGAKAGALICYEDLDSLSPRAFALRGADLLVNLTNELRFGYGLGPAQHLWFSRLRAVEYRKCLLRAVNTGATSAVWPSGRLAGELGILAKGRLALDAPLLPGATFYARHAKALSHTGGMALAALLLAALLRRKL